MRGNNLVLKKVGLSIFNIVLIFIIVSCSPKIIENANIKDNNTDQGNGQPSTVKDAIKQTVFDTDIIYLSEKGIELPDVAPDKEITTEVFLSLMVKMYEAIGGEIDISKVNPRSTRSDVVKKMTLINVYEDFFMVDNTLDSKLDHGAAAYWLMKLQDSVQNRLYWKSDRTATTGDLLRRINVSNALHTWTEDIQEMKAYTLADLVGDEVGLNQPLTRLLAAEMLVTAYEDVVGEIKVSDESKLSDTDNIYALKANQFFIWTETDQFEPEKLGKWDDWSFTSAIIYDSQVQLSTISEGTTIPYGAVISAMVSFLRGYEDMEQTKIEELIVLNERPYDWYIYQYDTGEYGYNNCMPSCIEMSLRYQALSHIPTAEQLRADNLMDGMGWYDQLAEDVMKQYGLQFTDSWDINQDTMLKYLDEGNILYVMYWISSIETGHASLIKGYWKKGDRTEFIISDPSHNLYGPFGYQETIVDAETMISNMEIHVPRYFVISADK